MSANLYEEAIADAKKLREVAEQNAKNKIIEAVTPKIRQLIEQELSDDDYMDDDDDMGEESDDMDDSPSMDAIDIGAPVETSMSTGTPDELVSDEPDVDNEDKSVTVNITVENDEIAGVAESALKKLGASRYKMAKDRAGWLVTKLMETKSPIQKKKIISELNSLQEELILIGNSSGKTLAKRIENTLLKETNMSRRTRRSRRLNENAWWLREGEELELGDEGGEETEEAVDTEAVSSALEDLGAALGIEVSVAEEEEEEDVEEEEMEAGEEDEEELELEGYFAEADDDEAHDEMYGEAHHDEMAKEMHKEADDDELAKEADDDETVMEISEAALRRELSRMARQRRRTRNISESSRIRRARLARRRRLQESDGIDNFGGGQSEGDVFVEVDEDTLLNALAEELGDMGNNSPTGDAVKKADNFGGGAVEKAVQSESRRRLRTKGSKLQKRVQLAEARARAAQKELKESNLFNAKLLYVNKLMQQHTLNTKQQRAIVEALDNAQTLREAKLLYTSLTESLNRRKSSKLNESTVRTGSASKSLRSSAPAKKGAELDRWAVLAGINKKS